MDPSELVGDAPHEGAEEEGVVEELESVQSREPDDPEPGEVSDAAGDGDEEDDEDGDGGDDEDEDGAAVLLDDEEEEEIDLTNYALPPLPPATAAPTVHGIGTDEVYSIIEELRRQMDDPVERARAKEMLMSDAEVLMAVAQVLQEAKLLRRSVVNENTGQVEQLQVPQPAAPPPQLPAGYNSWVVENKPKRGGRHRRR